MALSVESRPNVQQDVEGCNNTWYLIYSKPRQEYTAAENLLRQDFHVYLPQLRQWVRKRSRLKFVVSPMFPRYLFISLNISVDNCEPIRSTLGVVGLVRFGQKIAAVPSGLIEKIQSLADTDGIYTVHKQSLKIGDRVRIVEGVMQDYVGIITARSSKERVELLIAAVSSEIKIQLPLVKIEKIA